MTSADCANEIFLLPGGFHFGDCHTRIRTVLGSCVSITMWHPRLRVGGMCHYMLARRPSRHGGPLDGKYGEDAVMLFLAAAARHGVTPQEFEFKLFGAGNMFPEQACPAQADPRRCRLEVEGCRNVPCANAGTGRALLERHGLRVVAEDLGGSGHRNVLFDVGNGQVWVRQARGLVQ